MDLYVHDMPDLNIYPYRKDSLAKYCTLFQKNPKVYQPVVFGKSYSKGI